MDVPLGVAGFLVAFAGTAMMLLEGREHLFFPDFGVGTPLGLWELISKSLIFSVGYILLGIAIARPASCGVAPASCSPPADPQSPSRHPSGSCRCSSSATSCYGSGLAWLG